MALFANQTVYLGSIGAVFFMLMCIADLCKFKIRKSVQIFYLVLIACYNYFDKESKIPKPVNLLNMTNVI